jgi:type IV pilus assembly protein PilM
VVQSGGDIFKKLVTIKPKQPKLTVGLDIGSDAVKVVALGAPKPGGARPVVAQKLVPLAEGQESDPTAAIKQIMSALPIGTRHVNIAVSGQWVIMRIVEMPTMKPAEIKQALPFEAQRYLPFNIQDVIIDGAILGLADAKKTWVLIVACKKDLIERRLDWVKRAGLETVLIDVDALALANSFLASLNGRKLSGTRAVINVGAALTNLVIFSGDVPYLVRDIPWGADKMIRNVAEQLGSEAAAVTTALGEAQLNPEMQSAVKLSTEALVTELQLSFDYFENRFGQPPEELFISGGLGQSAGFHQGLKSHLTQPVQVWAPAQGLTGQFAVAHGLALRTS